MEGKMDTYTKAVLTVIAISLAVIALQNSGVLPAHAQTAFLSKIQICGLPLSGRGMDCAGVDGSALLVRAQ
jgi:hypothetical protein